MTVKTDIIALRIINPRWISNCVQDVVSKKFNTTFSATPNSFCITDRSIQEYSQRSSAALTNVFPWDQVSFSLHSKGNRRDFTYTICFSLSSFRCQRHLTFDVKKQLRNKPEKISSKHLSTGDRPISLNNIPGKTSERILKQSSYSNLSGEDIFLPCLLGSSDSETVSSTRWPIWLFSPKAMKTDGYYMPFSYFLRKPFIRFSVRNCCTSLSVEPPAVYHIHHLALLLKKFFINVCSDTPKPSHAYGGLEEGSVLETLLFMLYLSDSVSRRTQIA